MNPGTNEEGGDFTLTQGFHLQCATASGAALSSAEQKPSNSRWNGEQYGHFF